VERFARLLFWGRTVLGMSEDDVWMEPLGDLYDQIEIYRQFHGLAISKEVHYIDEIL
jgi:hypothetical protein